MWYPLVKAEGLKVFHILEGGHGQITFATEESCGVMKVMYCQNHTSSHLLPSLSPLK
jgi:hypothetical protein